jgi:hypothetical protein
MANGYAKYSGLGGSGGGGSGVSSLNGITGAVTLIAGTGISITPVGTNITISNTEAGGTVTSVGLALPGSLFTVSGSPVTTAGTLTGTLISQTANTFFAAPNGSAGVPTFRAIVAADIPNLNQNTTGTASNITATTNSTLTTLSALSLPGSQVTGNISGNAANITGTTNTTLTTLSSLSLPYSQVTGTPTPLIFADSLVNSAGTVTLKNDSATPTASQYYGTNASSVLGYYNLPAPGTGTVTNFSFTNANGFTGVVTNPTTTPNLTLTGTLTGDVTGTLTATALTATTNSTLTTLSALSLPGSQVTGNISGNSANVTGTVAIANGGTGQTTANAAFNALSPMTTAGDMIYENATPTATRLPIGTSGQYLNVSGAGIPQWTSVVPGAPQIAVFNETQSSGVSGGTFTQGAPQVRTLNTTQSAQSFASLASNQITLLPGTYYIEASAPALQVDNHQAWLFNVTSSTTALTGTSEYSSASGVVSNRSVIQGVITVATTSAFEILHQCFNGVATQGFGLAAGFGNNEIYTVISITLA